MIHFWDTNIILHTLRNPAFFTRLDNHYHFFDVDNQVFISIVSVGEIYAIALRNRWGATRRQQLIELLQQFKTIPLYDDAIFIDLYAQIGIYSQSHHPHLPLIGSARKMGKNDIWIATTATYLNATLLSTDNDFEHLNNVFLYFDKIEA